MSCARPGGLRVRRGNALAIISVLGILGLTMGYALVAFTTWQADLRTAKQESEYSRATQLIDLPTTIVISQIRSATCIPQSAWATQPGAIRSYSSNGQFKSGFKLYSDSNLNTSEEIELAFDTPPDDWASPSNRGRYTDLNAPILRDGEWIFPIVDPRAVGLVEGFSHNVKASGSSGHTPSLPMPVEWLYVLEDGTLGVLDDSNRFNGPTAPTADNPIVGRVAFWADDESCKINLNTASEPTFWDKPRTAGEEDRRYQKYIPANREYQRYPGHPATTALSFVLGKTGGNCSPAEKAAIYEIVPKIAPGGSEAATASIMEDPDVEPHLELDGERLFATTAEFLFPPRRQDLQSTREYHTEPSMERSSSFFLTAHSSAPELTLFGSPRISIWSIDAEIQPNSGVRTAHECLIAACTTIGNRDPQFDSLENPSEQCSDYYFRRLNEGASESDMVLLRNQQLMTYLSELTSKPVPGFGGNFLSKYKKDRDQILSAIFDYVKSKRAHQLVYMRGDSSDMIYVSPNRMIASAAKLGLIPSGILDKKYGRTLLFRPEPGHFGEQTPPDHLLLDLFWMPVVEPYGISGVFRTSGKVNLNQQILPFRNIIRTSALRAIIGDEQILASKADDPNDWAIDRVSVDVEKTMFEISSRFRGGGIFRSASQICEIPLVPADGYKRGVRQADSTTGDKALEQNYANLHARLTTQSNVFDIHYRVEAIKKARSTAPDEFDPDRDTVLASRRGATLLERFLDPENPSIPNYALSTPEQKSTEPRRLENFYEFRVIRHRQIQ